MTDDATTETRSPAGVEINGERYPLPTLDDLTLDEERVLYVYADTVISDFMLAHPDESDDVKLAVEMAQLSKLRNPEFKRALMHIAYRRLHPDVSDKEIQEAIGKANALATDSALLATMRGDALPPATSSQTEPANETTTSEPSTFGASGSLSGSGSGAAVVSLARTGTTESGTSSPPSPVSVSAS